MYRSIFVLSFLIGCSSGNGSSSALLRPGVEDSSKAYKGSPSVAESAFWVAVRNGDDAAQLAAVADLKKEVAADATDGYGAFLAAAHAFMPSTAFLRALAANQPLPQAAAIPDDTVPLLQQAVAHLTDPLYVGFSATLLAALQAQRDPPAAAKTLQLAVANNIPASSVGRINFALASGDVPGAYMIMYDALKFCNAGSLDPVNPDIGAFVDKANASGFVHRECYSGYHAMHGTEGQLLIIGDLAAALGNTRLANLYYQGMPRATNYASWPLKALAERRLSGAQPVKPSDLPAVLACTTCHISAIQ